MTVSINNIQINYTDTHGHHNESFGQPEEIFKLLVRLGIFSSIRFSKEFTTTAEVLEVLT